MIFASEDLGLLGQPSSPESLNRRALSLDGLRLDGLSLDRRRRARGDSGLSRSLRNARVQRESGRHVIPRQEVVRRRVIEEERPHRRGHKVELVHGLQARLDRAGELIRLVDWKRLSYAMRASRYDAALVLVTAFSAIFISVEFSILIGVALSILMFVPHAALLRWTELVVSSDRVVRERLPEDRPCTAMVLYDLEGELFFGAAPELDRCFDHLKRRTEDEDIHFVVLRLKRTRNPDMASLERFDHFLHDMETRGVQVLLCGVRPAFAKAMANLRFHDWLPDDRVFPEEAEKFSATRKAVRHVYELLKDNPCDHCMQAEFAGVG